MCCKITPREERKVYGYAGKTWHSAWRCKEEKTAHGLFVYFWEQKTLYKNLQIRRSQEQSRFRELGTCLRTVGCFGRELADEMGCACGCATGNCSFREDDGDSTGGRASEVIMEISQ